MSVFDAGTGQQYQQTSTGQYVPTMAPQVQPQQAMGAQMPAQSGGSWTPPPGSNPTDPAVVGQYVQWLSQQPGADPTLASDPNYWINAITQNGGGVTSDNIGYWNNRSKAGAGNAGGATGATAGNPYGTNGYMGSPGYAYEQKAAQDAVQASAAARGTLNTTGTEKDLMGAAAGIAGQAFSLDSSNLLQLAGIGQNATNNAGSYITAGANAGATGTINGANAQMAGLNNVNNAIQTGYNNKQLPGQNPSQTAATNTAQNYVYATPPQMASSQEDDGQ